VLVFERHLEERWLTIALNIGEREQRVELCAGGKVLISTHLDRSESADSVFYLRGAEGVILEMRADDPHHA
jgi:hypothetical protein